jgi:octaprenyl-diphosphate synthase
MHEVLPSAPLEALRTAATQDRSADLARTRLEDAERLVTEQIAKVHEFLAGLTFGPDPLTEAAQHLVQAGGKLVRPTATILVCMACGGDRTGALRNIAAATELVHTATLLHDDVIDEGEERRGRPASRVLWGNLVSVLSGDFVLTEALGLVYASGDHAMMGDLLDTLRKLVAGEVAQLKARNRDDMGLEGYLDVVRGKTASLFSFSCRAGAHAAHADERTVQAAGVFGEKLGLAFQIIDDVIDLQGDPLRAGKRLGADFAEGKTTLPLAFALQTSADRLRPWLMLARQGQSEAAAWLARDSAVIEGCVRARAYAHTLTEQGLRALQTLPDSPARAMLHSLVVTLCDRDS